LTHNHLLTASNVKHILVECTDFNNTRNKYFVASSMEELFSTTDVLLSKKLISTRGYDVLDFFHSSYVDLILSYF